MISPVVKNQSPAPALGTRYNNMYPCNNFSPKKQAYICCGGHWPGKSKYYLKLKDRRDIPRCSPCGAGAKER